VRTFRSDSAPDRRPTTAPLADRRPMDISRIENIHPRSYNDARRIGEHYRDGVPVIMNLTELDDTDAKRIIDFAAGLVFGLRGSIERITNKVFLLSPANVDVGDQARAQVAEDGFFNQS
jgi:cell division inhibitor SepF